MQASMILGRRLTINSCSSCCFVASRMFRTFSLLVNSSTLCWSLLSDSFSLATSSAPDESSTDRRWSMYASCSFHLKKERKKKKFSKLPPRQTPPLPFVVQSYYNSYTWKHCDPSTCPLYKVVMLTTVEPLPQNIHWQVHLYGTCPVQGLCSVQRFNHPEISVTLNAKCLLHHKLLSRQFTDIIRRELHLSLNVICWTKPKYKMGTPPHTFCLFRSFVTISGDWLRLFLVLLLLCGEILLLLFVADEPEEWRNIMVCSILNFVSIVCFRIF